MGFFGHARKGLIYLKKMESCIYEVSNSSLNPHPSRDPICFSANTPLSFDNSALNRLKHRVEGSPQGRSGKRSRRIAINLERVQFRVESIEAGMAGMAGMATKSGCGAWVRAYTFSRKPLMPRTGPIAGHALRGA